MSLVLDILGWAALVAGGFFCFVGALGLNRMPDVFTRMHATSVSDTLGVGFLTIGMLTQTDDWTVAIRLVIIVLVLFVTGAVASHALARAALHDGAKPVLADPQGNLRETECGAVFPDLAARLATPLTSEQVAQSVPDEDQEDGDQKDGDQEDEEAAPSNS